jgi:hypothetical protein
VGGRTRLTHGDVACWVLKSTRPPAELAPGGTASTPRALWRCVRRSYRLGLMGAGQPCLLWVSGRDRPGVHALGELAGGAEDGPDGAVVPVRLTPLPEPVRRADLLADPRMRNAEVLRIPAGSNPSWLSAEQFTAVLDRVPGDGLGRWWP